MPFITSQQNLNSASIYYEEMGAGKNVVFIHGWPMSGSMWEYQMTELPQKGLRCIFYDRRGFGKSSRTYSGYDYDTMAGDLKALLDELDLTDVTLVGFSMGGGEVAKYFSLYGNERISKVVLISTVLPFMLKTEDNPDGVPPEVFDGMAKKMKEDRPDFFENFGKDFYGVSMMSHPVSDAFLANNLTLVMDASPIATLKSAESFSSTDFRNDVAKINVPTLIIHGDKDAIVPIEVSSDKTSKMIEGAKYVVYEGAPHGLWYTEKDKLNKDLIDFILAP